jgi:hypothetical protein
MSIAEKISAMATPSTAVAKDHQDDEGEYGWIVSTDTLYEPSMVLSLLNTIRKYSGRATPVFLALEVRDKAVTVKYWRENL